MGGLFTGVDIEFVRRRAGRAVVAALIDDVRMCRFVEVIGGLERSFTGSDVEAVVVRTEADRFARGLTAFARVDGGRIEEALLDPIELVLRGREEVEMPDPVDTVVLRGLMVVGKRLEEAVFSVVAAGRLGILSVGFRIDLVLDGSADMVSFVCFSLECNSERNGQEKWFIC